MVQRVRIPLLRLDGRLELRTLRPSARFWARRDAGQITRSLLPRRSAAAPSGRTGPEVLEEDLGIHRPGVAHVAVLVPLVIAEGPVLPSREVAQPVGGDALDEAELDEERGPGSEGDDRGKGLTGGHSEPPSSETSESLEFLGTLDTRRSVLVRGDL